VRKKQVVFFLKLIKLWSRFTDDKPMSLCWIDWLSCLNINNSFTRKHIINLWIKYDKQIDSTEEDKDDNMVNNNNKVNQVEYNRDKCRLNLNMDKYQAKKYWIDYISQSLIIHRKPSRSRNYISKLHRNETIQISSKTRWSQDNNDVEKFSSDSYLFNHRKQNSSQLRTIHMI
jgi:hypothetical protein